MTIKSVYRGAVSYSHDEDKLGILLANLGTPTAPTAAGIRPFLRRFLNDQRVIENKSLIWKFLLNCIIIPIRAPKSASAYRSIWSDGDSPLNTYSFGLVNKLRELLTKKTNKNIANIIVELGMSYSKPSITNAMNQLRQHNITKLLVLPLYPQYSCSTVASVFDSVADELKQWRLVPDLRMVTSYHDNPAYINALAKSVKQFHKNSSKDKITGKNTGSNKGMSKNKLLIFSFHGMPLSSLLQGDPYHCQCHKTARLVAEKLGLKSSEYKVCFQSRFGRSKWLQPYTDKTLELLPKQGIKNVVVICPGFATDCVETLEEIDDENRKKFMESGGLEFEYIPCLNDSTEQIKLFETLVMENASDLLNNLKRTNSALSHRQKQSQQLAKSNYYEE